MRAGERERAGLVRAKFEGKFSFVANPPQARLVIGPPQMRQPSPLLGSPGKRDCRTKSADSPAAPSTCTWTASSVQMCSSKLYSSFAGRHGRAISPMTVWKADSVDCHGELGAFGNERTADACHTCIRRRRGTKAPFERPIAAQREVPALWLACQRNSSAPAEVVDGSPALPTGGASLALTSAEPTPIEPSESANNANGPNIGMVPACP